MKVHVCPSFVKIGAILAIFRPFEAYTAAVDRFDKSVDRTIGSIDRFDKFLDCLARRGPQDLSGVNVPAL